MIETQRLLIKPLTYSQLMKYIQSDNSLEKELGLNSTERSISPELKEALEQTILPHVADIRKNYLYCTLWTIISKQENKMIGDLCFTGEPNSAGEIEMGYGTYERFRKMGFMTEAVGGMIDWSKNQAEIKTVIAETDKGNRASWTVLEKNGFTKTGETATFFRWHLPIK